MLMDDDDPDPDYVVSNAGTFNVNGSYFRPVQDPPVIVNGVYAYQHENGNYWLFRVYFPGDEDTDAGNYWVFQTTLPVEGEVLDPSMTVYYTLSSSSIPYEGTYQVGYQGIAPGARVQRY
jgi:hypothetical protein